MYLCNLLVAVKTDLLSSISHQLLFQELKKDGKKDKDYTTFCTKTLLFTDLQNVTKITLSKKFFKLDNLALK